MLLGDDGHMPEWESVHILGTERSTLRDRLRTKERPEYGVEELALSLPSGARVRLWLEFQSMRSEAWVHRSTHPDGFANLVGADEIDRCTSIDVRGEFDGESRANAHRVLMARFGPPKVIDDRVELFFDVKRRRRLMWFGYDDNDYPVFVVERFMPLADVFGAKGRVRVGKLSWPEIDSAGSFVLAGAIEHWDCRFGNGWGDQMENGECTLPSSETSHSLRMALSFHPDGWQGLRVSGSHDETGVDPIPAVEAALTASLGPMLAVEDGVRRFPGGVTLHEGGEEVLDTWTVRFPRPKQRDDP